LELLLGCGRDRERRIAVDGRRSWTQLVTLDHNPDHAPDVVHDLEELPYPFADNTFSEIHAYEVLEHIGQQGDWRTFFAQFQELWRILQPGGSLAATCPSYRSIWAWGDPSHRRVLTSGTLVFLSQAEYERQVGVTPMSDFRPWYSGDFEPVAGAVHEDAERLWFVLQAVKPARLRTPAPEVTRADSLRALG
jgi:SAM-dependent methyltransferase